MHNNNCIYGFVTQEENGKSAKMGKRQITLASAALSAYTSCDPVAETHCETYLSAFQYDDAFYWYLDTNKKTAGFSGICWCPFIWWDFDSEGDIEKARKDAVKLAIYLIDRYGLDDDDLVLMFSGSKGFGVGLSTYWQPEPSETFNRVARAFAIKCATAADALLTMDTGIYAKVQILRAPNSRHSKTGLYKRSFPLQEVMELPVERIKEIAQQPAPFDLPEPTGNKQAAADWEQSFPEVVNVVEARKAIKATGATGSHLNRATLECIQQAPTQERHKSLFAAAANLAELGCPAELVIALLTPSGLNCGLEGWDVKRQIECGHRHGKGENDQC